MSGSMRMGELGGKRVHDGLEKFGCVCLDSA